MKTLGVGLCVALLATGCGESEKAQSAEYAVLSQAMGTSLVITEVMQDPEPVLDGFGEWFEVHNPAPVPVDLNGWTFADSRNDSFTVDRSVMIPAGGYVVLGRLDDMMLNNGVTVDYAYGHGMSLANQVDQIILTDPMGDEVDRIEWDKGFIWPNPIGAGKASQFGLESAGGNNNDGSKWCYATTEMPNTNLGTPGAENTICVAPVCGDGVLAAGIEECDDGNVVAGDGCDAMCHVEVFIVITEVMQDPASVSDGFGEWFEVHNPTTSDADLNGWTLTDENNNTVVINGETIVPAGGYAVLARTADQGINGGIAVDYAYGSGFSLANSADKIVLLDANGGESDRVEWDNGQLWPNPRGQGESMQFDAIADPLSDDNNVGGAWCRPSNVLPNGDSGSPGAENNACELAICGDGLLGFGEGCDDGNVVAGDGCSATCEPETVIVITEVMQDPASVSDGFGEWFEVYNPTGTPIDMTGWTLTDENNESVVLGRLIVPAQGYSVLGHYTNRRINGGVRVKYGYGAGFRMANLSDRIVLIDAAGTEIDRVEWDNGQQWPNPKGRGHTMQLDQLIDVVNEDNNNPARWCRPTNMMANGDFGSPGSRNNDCAPRCGDGTVDEGEACDDGNLVAGDGCDASCQAEAACGDGEVGAGEQCDDGNMVAGDGCDAQCQFEADLVVTEVMQDPTVVADGLGEWFEVYNPTPNPVDLEGWMFSDNGTDSFTVNESVVVPAMGYAVLGRYEDMGTNGGVAVDYGYGSHFVMANIADEIVVTNPAGTELDRVEWDNGQTWPNPQGRGRSMQLDPAADDNSDPANWCRPTSVMANGESGTPGAVNDDCPVSACGDGMVDAGEACDDGNTTPGDGCDAQCRVEPECGDGAVDGFEECDDGNQNSGDGCDAICTLESMALPTGQTVLETGFAADSSDTFSFTVDDGASFLVIETSDGNGGCPGDTVFTLTRGGAQVAQNDNGGTGECSLLQMPIAPGDYELMVDSPGPALSYTLNYTLVVAVQVPAGGTFAGATAPGGNDIYGFSLAAASDVNVAVSDGAGACPAGVDSTVSVFSVDAQGVATLVADNDDGELAPCSSLSISQLGAGNYSVLVADAAGGALAPHMVTIDFGPAAVCGNGMTEAGEQCDDGNAVAGDGCDADCQIESFCGDGMVDSGEACDDGNNAPGDGCDADCTLETDCGDGEVEGVEQCDDGNAVDGDGCSAVCRFEPVVVITEIMTDPSGVDDLQGEWFEVHNPTANPVDLMGWTFTDGNSDTFTVNLSTMIPAGGYAVLGRLYDQNSNGGVDVDFAYGLDMALANTRNDGIIVSDPMGNEVDRVEWTNVSWPSPSRSGVSLNFNSALDQAMADNNDGANWCHATSVIDPDLGTPGAANDACP